VTDGSQLYPPTDPKVLPDIGGGLTALAPEQAWKLQALSLPAWLQALLSGELRPPRSGSAEMVCSGRGPVIRPGG